MRKTAILMIALLSVTMMSCGQRIDGSSDENFKESREKVAQSLDGNEKENLEKAFRVIALKAMKELWNNPDQEKDLDEISLQIVDEKTYRQLVRIAEEFLKKENEEKKEKVKAKLQELEAFKANYEKSKRSVRLLNVIIEKTTFFEEEALRIVFNYRFEQAGSQAVTHSTKNAETGDVMSEEIATYENIAEGYEAYDQYVILRKKTLLDGGLSEEQVQNLFNAVFPIPQKNFLKYGIDFQAYSFASDQAENSGRIDEKSYIETKESLQFELQRLEQIKGTLDELELTE